MSFVVVVGFDDTGVKIRVVVDAVAVDADIDDTGNLIEIDQELLPLLYQQLCVLLHGCCRNSAAACTWCSRRSHPQRGSVECCSEQSVFSSCNEDGCCCCCFYCCRETAAAAELRSTPSQKVRQSGGVDARICERAPPCLAIRINHCTQQLRGQCAFIARSAVVTVALQRATVAIASLLAHLLLASAQPLFSSASAASEEQEAVVNYCFVLLVSGSLLFWFVFRSQSELR